jgi:hypothetical protein
VWRSGPVWSPPEGVLYLNWTKEILESCSMIMHAFCNLSR